jgi:hypothetical protein
MPPTQSEWPTVLGWIVSRWGAIVPQGAAAAAPGTCTPLLHRRECGAALRFYFALSLLQLEDALVGQKAQPDDTSELARSARLLRSAISFGMESAALRRTSSLQQQLRGDPASPHGGVGEKHVMIEPSLALHRPSQAALDATLVDKTVPFLRAAKPALPAWLDQCEKHHHAIHDAIETIVLSGADGTVKHPRLKHIVRLLQRCSLVTVPGYVAAASGIDAAMAALDDDGGGQDAGGESTLGGSGVAFCMMENIARWVVLLRAALDDSVTSTSATVSAEGSASLTPSEALSVALSLSMADRSVAYHFPPAEFGAARSFLVKLSDAGFVFAMNVEGVQMFLVHPSLHDCVMYFGQHQQQSDKRQPGAHRAAEYSPFTEAMAPFRKKHRTEGTPAENDVLARLSRRSKANVGATAVSALMRLGHSRDVNAVSHHDRDARANDASGRARVTVWADTADTIVTETNYRLYVYLRPCVRALNDAEQASPEHVLDALPHSSRTLLRLLDQFAVRDILVPRFAVYRLTRNKFLAAVRKGITQQQILGYLASKAHPSARAKDPSATDATNASVSAMLRESEDAGPIAEADASLRAPRNITASIPQSIADQLSLWEREARRVQFQANVVLLQAPNSLTASRIIELLEASPVWHGGRGLVAKKGLSIAVAQQAYDDIFAARLPASAVVN